MRGKIKFYHPGDRPRKRWHCPMTTWEDVLGFTQATIEEYGFATINGSPMRFLISRDIESTRKDALSIRDSKGVVWSAVPFKSSAIETTPGARVERAIGDAEEKSWPPADKTFEFTIIERFEHGVVIELPNYHDINWKPNLAQTALF